MKIKQLTILFFTLIGFASGLSPKIQKKVDKVIKTTFEIESFSFNAMTISPKVAEELPSKFGSDNFFKIESENQLYGYAYVARASSKTAEYDYLVLLDSKLSVVKAKVLIYREEYGGEIGSRRWLKQFIGKTQNDEFRYGDNIDAIAGATISVRSMTNAMNDLMQSLKVLNAKGIL